VDLVSSPPLLVVPGHQVELIRIKLRVF